MDPKKKKATLISQALEITGNNCKSVVKDLLEILLPRMPLLCSIPIILPRLLRVGCNVHIDSASWRAW